MSIWQHVAYLDAGTGSLIVQALIGAIAGVALFGRRMFAVVTHKLNKLRGKAASSTSSPAKEQDEK